jgi:hypothetical protein
MLPMSVEMLSRFVAPVEEPQDRICCRAVQIIGHYSGIRSGR